MRAPLLVALFLASPAFAQDVTLTHQVRILDASGGAVNGTREITVALFADANGAPIWSETFDARLENGFASLELGQDATSPLPAEVAADARYAQVSVDGVPVGPPKRLSSVPVAARSIIADSVDGDVSVQDLKLETETDSDCASADDYGSIRWTGTAFQGCRPGGWSNLLMSEPGASETTGVSKSPGMVAYFEGSCPAGWSEKSEMRGRVVVAGAAANAGDLVGAALSAGGTRTITAVPAHTHGVSAASASTSSGGAHAHSVNPPSTRSGNQTANHTHSVNPPSTNTNSSGNHNHGIATRQDDWNVSGGPPGGRPSWGTDNGPYAVRHSTQNDGTHAHSVDIPTFTSGTISASHQHDIDIGAFDSASAGAHTHTVSISGQTATSTGAASVDVTMPYIHLTACEID